MSTDYPDLFDTPPPPSPPAFENNGSSLPLAAYAERAYLA